VAEAPASAESDGEQIGQNSPNAEPDVSAHQDARSLGRSAMMEDIMVALVHSRSVSTSHGIERVRPTVLGLVGRLAAAMTREIRIRHDLARLQSLDDTTLHDIGLSRGQIEHAVRHGRPLGARTVGN
jgi:uncharacterized protein YjiS (DUF1127 family)